VLVPHALIEVFHGDNLKKVVHIHYGKPLLEIDVRGFTRADNSADGWRNIFGGD
jgi:hypothetical protein